MRLATASAFRRPPTLCAPQLSSSQSQTRFVDFERKDINEWALKFQEPTGEKNSSREPGSQREDGEFMSTTEIAKLLFVSRPHVVKLIDQDKLELHHITVSNRFVRRDSVFAYQAGQQAAIEAYHTGTSTFGEALTGPHVSRGMKGEAAPHSIRNISQAFCIIRGSYRYPQMPGKCQRLVGKRD